MTSKKVYYMIAVSRKEAIRLLDNGIQGSTTQREAVARLKEIKEPSSNPEINRIAAQYSVFRLVR